MASKCSWKNWRACLPSHREHLPIRYVFFGVELVRTGGEANDFSWYKAGDRNNRKAKLIYESFFSLAVRVPTSAEYNLFASKVVERASDSSKANAVNVGLGHVPNDIMIGELMLFCPTRSIHSWLHSTTLSSSTPGLTTSHFIWTKTLHTMRKFASFFGTTSSRTVSWLVYLYSSCSTLFSLCAGLTGDIGLFEQILLVFIW